MPKVSILLPCLNARAYLEPRVESLLAQTCPDWEAIVLDSHSDDGSWEFFQSIAARDSRFRLNQVPREGVYAALNRGVQLASGEFLHIATCDDTMVPQFLSAMLEAFKRCSEAGIAACDVSLIDENGNTLSAEQLVRHLPPSSINDLLDSGHVRTSRGKRRAHQLSIASSRLLSALCRAQRLLLSNTTAHSHGVGKSRGAFRDHSRIRGRLWLVAASY